MANLEDVIIKFKCKYCKRKSEMTAEDLMNAGTEGPPYCTCTEYNTDLDVIDVRIEELTKEVK